MGMMVPLDKFGNKIITPFIRSIAQGGDTVSEKEKEIVKKIKEALPNMDERSKGYFLGYAEAMASKSERAEPDKKEARP